MKRPTDPVQFFDFVVFSQDNYYFVGINFQGV